MKLDFERNVEKNLEDVSYGDVLILENNSKWLIIRDTDDLDFRGINLETFELTEYQSSIRSLVAFELDDIAVIKIIKSEDLVLGVK